MTSLTPLLWRHQPLYYDVTRRKNGPRSWASSKSWLKRFCDSVRKMPRWSAIRPKLKNFCSSSVPRRLSGKWRRKVFFCLFLCWYSLSLSLYGLVGGYIFIYIHYIYIYIYIYIYCTLLQNCIGLRIVKDIPPEPAKTPRVKKDPKEAPRKKRRKSSAKSGGCALHCRNIQYVIYNIRNIQYTIYVIYNTQYTIYVIYNIRNIQYT